VQTYMRGGCTGGVWKPINEEILPPKWTAPFVLIAISFSCGHRTAGGKGDARPKSTVWPQPFITQSGDFPWWQSISSDSLALVCVPVLPCIGQSRGHCAGIPDWLAQTEATGVTISARIRVIALMRTIRLRIVLLPSSLCQQRIQISRFHTLQPELRVRLSDRSPL